MGTHACESWSGAGAPWRALNAAVTVALVALAALVGCTATAGGGQGAGGGRAASGGTVGSGGSLGASGGTIGPAATTGGFPGGTGGTAPTSTGGRAAGASGGAPVDAGLGGTVDARTETDAVASVDGDGPPAVACPAAALVCEDFEDGNLDGWTAMPAGGAISIDNTHAVSGRSALSIDIPGNQRGGFIERRGAPLFPLPAGVLWGRLMVYFAGVPDGHSDIVRGAPAGDGVPWYNVGEQHGEILLNYYNGAPTDCWARPSPGRPVPAGTWMCWEWSFDSARNEMQFFVDGQLSRRVNAIGDGCVTGGNQTWAAPTFSSIRIGEYIAEISATPTRIWIDDVALGNTQRLGCPPRP